MKIVLAVLVTALITGVLLLLATIFATLYKTFGPGATVTIYFIVLFFICYINAEEWVGV